MLTPKFILASSSRYRQQQLANIGIVASCVAPDIDESARPNEDAKSLALRLAENKARKVASLYKANDTQPVFIIAADQTATINGDENVTILAKPLTHQRAVEQLTACQNQCVEFFSALCVMNAYTGQFFVGCEPTHVHFKQLDSITIDNYLKAEQPYDCAGSFKVEGLGSLLFNKISSRDPSALIGLPVMLLRDLCEQHSVNLLAVASAQKISEFGNIVN